MRPAYDRMEAANHLHLVIGSMDLFHYRACQHPQLVKLVDAVLRAKVGSFDRYVVGKAVELVA